MSDLFIIGNGFDRAHGMETSYYDFHQFIKDNCKNMPYIGVVELVSQDSENKIDGMIVYEPVEYLEFFQIIIDQTDGPDWKNFEDALGRLDFSDILRDYGTTYDTDSIKYLNGRSIESINQAVLTVKEMFPLWVKSILIDSRIKKKDRIQEMLNLGYFDLYSKGGKLRRLYIPKKLREETQKWLSEEQRTSGYLFLNRFGERITARGISQQLKNYADKYGLDSKVIYPHSFRHLYAKNFLEKYNDIALLADLMGHESIETTRIYLRRTATEQQSLIDKIVTW